MKKYKLLITLFSIFFCVEIKAQIPMGDSAWKYQTATSEEFTTFPDTVNKWRPRYSWGNINNGAEIMMPSSLSNSGGVFTITADSLTTPVFINPSPFSTPAWSGGKNYNYKSGMIESRDTSYKYGYIEIYAQYPTGDSAFWPAFWFFNSGCTSGNPWYNEIDAAENGSWNSYDGHQIGTDWHVFNTPPPNCSGWGNATLTSAWQTLTGFPLLSDTLNKFAIEWQPDMIKWYFNDQVVRTIYNSTNLPNHNMKVILNFALDPNYTANSWNTRHPPHINFPVTFKFDYIRHYKLETDCSNTQTITCPVNPSNIRKVKKSISTDNTCTPTFNTSDNITLRATDFILLDVGTTINDNGSGSFTIITIPCPN